MWKLQRTRYWLRCPIPRPVARRASCWCSVRSTDGEIEDGRVQTQLHHDPNDSNQWRLCSPPTAFALRIRCTEVRPVDGTDAVSRLPEKERGGAIYGRPVPRWNCALRTSSTVSAGTTALLPTGL